MSRLSCSFLQLLTFGIVVMGMTLVPSTFGQMPVPPTTSESAAPAGPPIVIPPTQPGQVSFDAVVVDGKKKGPHFAIGGLHEKDFTIFDNGKPQKLVGFQEVDTTAHPDAVHVLIVVDMVNAQFDRIAYMREQLGEFLKQNGGKLAHPTAVAVMSEAGVSMMGGSTYDGNALNANFQKVRTDMRDIGRAAGFYGDAERIEISLTDLRQIVDFEATRPGRKLVIVISPGWRMLAMAGVEEDMLQRDWVFNAITEITSELRAGNVTLYSVDPLELGNRDPFFYESYLKPVKLPKQAEYPTLSLQVFAAHSGGQAITMGRDVKGELNAAMRDAGPYYRLTYVPQVSDIPNEYHQIQVKTDLAGQLVRAETGYYSHVEIVGGHKAHSVSRAPKPY